MTLRPMARWEEDVNAEHDPNKGPKWQGPPPNWRQYQKPGEDKRKDRSGDTRAGGPGRPNIGGGSGNALGGG
jgi:hypothetical protein